jgi:archaeal flagellar protein FlaG
MSAETFTTAMFLITAVIAAGVLINAIFPVVYTMSSTFSSATHESDQRLRTDFKIVTYQYASSGTYTNEADIWMKNTGSARIPLSDIAKSDVFSGPEGHFGRLQYTNTTPDTGQWTTEFGTDADNKEYDLNSNGYWDSGETLHIIAYPTTSTAKGETVYFQFILPDGIWRSTTFSAS